MKKSTIVVLILILAAVIAMLFNLISAGNYSGFRDARTKPGQTVTIIGELNKSKPIQYDANVNANLTKFYVVDRNGDEELVLFHKPKPRDIEKSEEITMEGKMIKGQFHAVHILLKCPSKYNPKAVGVKDTVQREYSAPIPE